MPEPVAPSISPDPRPPVPAVGDERTLLLAVLDHDRRTMILKVEGLSLEQATRRLVPSETTLLGIVKHLAVVEGHWFRTALHGEVLPVPYSEEDPDGDFRIREQTDGAIGT